MDIIIERLLDKYNLLSFQENFILAGVRTLQDIAHIDRTTLRSYYCMLDADINNFEKLRNECIIMTSSKRATPGPPMSYRTPNAPRSLTSGVGSSSISSMSSTCWDYGPQAMGQQSSSLVDITDEVVYDSKSRFPIGTVSRVGEALILNKYSQDEDIVVKSKLSQHSTKIPNYELDNSCKGLGLIMVIDKFVDGQVRVGAVDDVKKLEVLFRKMNLIVIIEDNCSSPQKVTSSIKHKLSTNKRLSSFFIAISSYGGDGNKILCADNQAVSVSDILAAVSNFQTPELAGKPKVILIEAICNPVTMAEKEKKVASYTTTTKECDILVSYAYISGYMVRRDPGKHSWFITSLCKAYDEQIGEGESFVNILTYTNYIMLERLSGKEEYVCNQPIQVESTLTKILVL